MPQVRYGQRKVSLQPLADVRRSGAETNLSTGATLEEVRSQAAAEGGRGLAQGVGAVATTIATIQAEARRQASDASVLDYNNKLALKSHELMYSGPKAVLNRQKLDAQSAPEEVAAEFQAYAAQLAQEGLHTREAQEAGAKLAAQISTSLDLQAREHAFSEQKEYHKDVLDGTLAMTVMQAEATPYNDDLVAIEINKADAALIENGPHLGMDAQQIEVARKTQHTAIHATVLRRMIADKSYKEANAYWAQHRDDVWGPEKAKLEEQVKLSSTRGEGYDAAQKVFQPTSKAEKVSMQTYTPELRKMFPDDPEKYDAARMYLAQLVEDHNAAIQITDDNNSGAVQLAIASGRVSLRQMQSMPEFMALTPGEQAKAERDMLAYTAARLNQDRSVLANLEESKKIKGLPEYWGIRDNLTALRAMSVNQLNARRGDLGNELVDDLLKVRENIQQTDNYTEAQLDDNVIKTVATASLGIPAFQTSLNTNQKAALGRFDKMVKDEVNYAQSVKGKKLTREEKDAIVQRVADQKVLFDTFFGGGKHQPDFSEQYPAQNAFVVSPGKLADAYVPFNRISPSSRASAVAALRRLIPTLNGLTDAQILAQPRYQNAIGHAGAVAINGGTQDEVDQALLRVD